MRDIFDNAILCSNCNKSMKDEIVSKNGFNLRVKSCTSCNEKIVHPRDLSEYEDFMRLKKKDFEVKMRMVGNSYAVSIPREIVDFMEENKRMIDNMVRLSFEDFGRLSLAFNTEDNEDAHTISAKEVRVVKNGKEVLHARKFSDSKHPERNKTIIKKNEKELEEDE